MYGRVSTLLVSLVLGGMGLVIVAYPFLGGNQNSVTVGFTISVEEIFLVASMGVAVVVIFPSNAGRAPPMTTLLH